MMEEIQQASCQMEHTSLLSVEAMGSLGKKLTGLCDQLEQHGLADYEMGLWEEEILPGETFLFFLMIHPISPRG